MTTIEMQYEFETLLHTVSDVFKEDESILTEEVFESLNRAQERYIKLKYLNGNTVQENIAILNARQDEIRNLIGTYTFTSVLQAAENPNLYYVVPTEVWYGYDNYLHYIDSQTKITKTSNPVISVAEYVPNIFSTYIGLEQFYTTTYNIPVMRFPLITMGYKSDVNPGKIVSPQTFRILVDSMTTPEEFFLTYLRKPKTLVLEITDANTQTTKCELVKSLHQELVEMAVSIYLDEYKMRLVPKSK